MLDASGSTPSYLAIEDDHVPLVDMVRAFAAEKFAPNAVEWDEKKHFPISEMRQGAALGMGGICIRADVGGSALSRVEAVLIFEALATGCPTIAAYMAIHNQAA